MKGQKYALDLKRQCEKISPIVICRECIGGTVCGGMINQNVGQMFEKLLHKRNNKNPKNGKWKEFSKQAVLVAEGNYQDDFKDGLWKQYYESGELLIEETYDKGMLHGRYASYHLNGRLLSEGDYIDGQREGFFYIYDESGKHVRSLLFVSNVLVEEMDLLKPPKLEPQVEGTRYEGRGKRSRGGVRHKV